LLRDSRMKKQPCAYRVVFDIESALLFVGV